jgi:shikimate kinase
MQSLTHVLWIGGPPGSGKTAIATRIARRHGLRWYNADTQTWAHRDRALREGLPAALRWEAMTPDERWVSATQDEIDELSLDSERGAMILDDLRRLPASPLIIAEGTPLRPDVVAPVLATASQCVWLVPTPELQRARLDARGLRRDVSDPERARDSAIQRSLLIGREIARQARRHGQQVLTLDGSLGVDEVVAAVERTFARVLAEGPRAETLAERRVLLRRANAAIVSQVRGYYARPWADGDPDSVVRSFVCECGRGDCDASVERAVGAVSDEPALAPGHG